MSLVILLKRKVVTKHFHSSNVFQAYSECAGERIIMGDQTSGEDIDGDEVMDTVIPCMDEVSPYDSSFPIKFLLNGLKSRTEQADRAVKAIYRTVAREASTLAQTGQALKKGCRYVLDVTDNTMEAIESGKIKLTTEKSGQMFAQIRESSGHYGSKLPIKREEFFRGIDTVQMANTMQMKALHNLVEGLIEQIEEIDHNVKDVLQGQQNDRIGLYYSGMMLFLEAQGVNDKEMKRALIIQSLRGLSEATFQLTLMLQSDVEYLVNRKYQFSKGKKVELIEERMQSIHQSFAFIHQATMLRAGIYCEQGEVVAMSTVFAEYARFIDETIAKNAGLLAQCDTSDSGTESGIWKTRANLKLDVADFIKQIKLPEKTFYLGVEMEEEAWQG